MEPEPPSPNKQSRWHFAAALIADARLGRGMLLGGALYGVLVFCHLPVLPCAWRAVTGLPCPGCGMTRSTLALLRGDWQQSLRDNALTWVLLVFWMVVAAGLAVPARHRAGVVAAIGAWEQRTRWPLWFGLALVIYTLTRWFGLL